MPEVVECVFPVVLLGLGASWVMDAWMIVRKPLLGMPAPDYGRVGRWLLRLLRGQFRYDPAASVMRGERLAGWTAHYLIGIVFAALLLLAAGPGWLHRPTLAPALLMGVGSVIAPLLILQPALGAGLAGRHTPNPAATRAHSLVTHTVFGLGLYATARVMAPWF